MKLGLFDFRRKRETHPDHGPDAVSVDVGVKGQRSEQEEYVSPEDLAELWDSLASDLDEMSLDDLEDQLSEAPETDADLSEWADAVDEDSLKALVDSFVTEHEAAAESDEEAPDILTTADEVLLEEAAGEEEVAAVPTEPELSAEDDEEYDDLDFDASAAARFQDEAVEDLGGAESFYANADEEFDPESFDESGFMAQLEALERAQGPSPEQESQPPAITDAMGAAADLLSEMMESESGGSHGFETESVGDAGEAQASDDAPTSDRASEILREFHAEEDSADHDGPGPDGSAMSGVVSDEVVLALMHEGVIRVAQVYDASRHRRTGEPLWRAMLQLPEIDRGTVLAAVAKHAGYPVYEKAEDLPVRNLVENMRETLSPDAIEGILYAGGIPVEIGIDAESYQYRLILTTDDPASAALKRAAESLPVDVDIRYMPTELVDRYLDEVCPDRPPREVAFLEGDVAEAVSEVQPRADRAPEHGNQDRAVERPWPTKKKGAKDKAGEADQKAPEPVPVERPGVEQDVELLDRRARKDRVVAALFKEGAVSIEQVEKALQKYGQDGGKEAIWRVLSTVPGVDREAIFSKAAKVYAFPRVTVDETHPDHEFVMLIMETIAEERREDLLRLNLLPFEYAIDAETGGARLIFVTHDPARSEVHRLLAQLKVGRFELRYASEIALTKVITEIFPKRNEYLDRMSTNEEPAFDYGAEYQSEESDLVNEGALEAEMSRSVLINLFEASLIEAVRQGASDLHIYPNPKRHIEIHFRVDGRLRRWHSDEKVSAEAFLAVVKDNSTNVDRFERDMAQDGFIQRRIDDVLIRFRVSVLPIASANQEIRAESVVIRVLDDRKVLTDLSKLGMLESAMERVQRAISQPHGMVILTGPTGSGKSTTLVAALYQVISPEVNVLTIEDPVEYIINGVRQIKLSHKLGLEDAIRAVLRHDPDIVMVGEMRDKPTADLAIKLANTGHLTFSTLHTNDAASAVSRLYKMGVEPFLLAYAINLIVAQRLIRQLCPTCKRPEDKRDKVLMERLGFTADDIEDLEIMKAVQDPKCPTCKGGGYKGRRAISETLYFSQEIRHIVAESGEDIDEEALTKQAIKEGMLTLQDCAREIVREGGTTLDEMMRVTASE